MKRTLAIWLPNWPIQRLRQLRSEQSLEASSKLLVLQQRDRRGQSVVACSADASAKGIAPGMPMAEVKAIVQTDRPSQAQAKTAQHTGLEIATYDPIGDREALGQLAAWCYQFSPLSGMDDAEPPETVLLDVEYALPLIGDEQALVDQVDQAFRERGLQVRLALADTIGAAWALAHHHPGSSVIVPPGRHSIELQDLPIEALRLDAAVEHRLNRLGLQQIGQLYDLPRTALQSRFGPQLLQRLDQALGQAPELIQVIEQPMEFEVDWLFEHPVEHRETIDQVIQRLMGRLGQMLRDHQQGALRIACHLICADDQQVAEIGLFRPTTNEVHLNQLVQVQLEKLILSGPLTKITVGCTVHEAIHEDQAALFDEPQRRHDSAIVGSVMDRIAGRLGRDRVVRCLFQPDAQPERAFRYEPVIGERSRRKSRASRTAGSTSYAPTCGPLDRPLHMLAEPVAIQVRATTQSAPIHQFCWQAKHHKIERLWGPERIETGWWRNRGIRRDYYRAETKTGQRFWLFRCLRTHQWYLQGIFG